MDEGEDERRRLSGLIEDHLRRYGAEASRVAETFAQLHDMHPTDLQALVLIMNAERQGTPATPKVLRQALNLTSGAITGVVDRLVASGHIRRETDAADRRRTRLLYAESGMALAVDFFGPLGARTDAIMAAHSVAELRLLEGFLDAVVETMAEHRRSL